MTLNNNWGYTSKDKDYKSAKNVIRTLVQCVSKGGNMLINVGPDAKGEIPEESVKVLEEVGKWMHRNSESIYGCGKAEIDKPEWGYYTQKDNKLYAHIFDRGIATFRFDGLEGKIKNVRLLSDNSEIIPERPWYAADYPNDAFIELGTALLPDDTDTVIAMDLKLL